MSGQQKGEEGEDKKPERMASDILVLRCVGAVLALGGAFMLVGWALQGGPAAGFLPYDPTGKANSSLGFVLSGSAMLLQTFRGRAARPGARVAVIGAALIAVLTLLEYALTTGPHIERFLFLERLTPVASNPGRMGVNSAICLLLAASCVWVLGRAGTARSYNGAVAWLGALMTAVALAAFAAHFEAKRAGYNWLNMTSMALPAAVLYVVQGVGCVWVASKRAAFRWAIGRALSLEFACGLFLLVAVAVMTRWSATRIWAASAEIVRSGQALERMLALRKDVDALEAAAREYALKGGTDPVPLWTKERPAWTTGLDSLQRELRHSAGESPKQAERLSLLQEALGHWVESVREAMALRNAAGLEAAQRRLGAPDLQQRRDRFHGLLSELAASEGPRIAASHKQLHKILERTFGLVPPVTLVGMLVLSYGMVRLSIEMDKRERTADALKLVEARQRLAVEAAGIGDWELNLATHTFTRSLRHDQIFGYPQLLPEWSYERFLEHVEPEDRARVNGLYLESIRQAGEWAVECRIRKQDGKRGWIWLRGKCFKNHAGRVEWVRGVIGDSTERRAAEEEIRSLNASLEQRVGDRTEKLELAIKELDAFSYSVSHDLRTPLRAIDGFSRMLLEDHSGELHGEAQRKLGVIRSEAQRMSRLIDDLLAFSRLGRAQVQPEPIDMRALAQDVFSELLDLGPNNRKIEFELHALPPAIGTHAMVRQVWTNLLSNALKFTRGRAVARIEVGAGGGSDGHPVYFIKDNGVGFDMRHASKLFGVFERLHSDKDFEGTGAGLALVQRIVNRHGGRVWAEAQPDQGATFYFTLPTPNA